jgi:Na+-driven multidrug efflux pump
LRPASRLSQRPLLATGSSASQGTENKKDSRPETKPQLVREVLSFALPVLGACLVEPLLTLCDTWFVGNKLASAHLSAIGLAALAANCSLFNRESL